MEQRMPGLQSASVRTFELPPIATPDRAAPSVRVVYGCPHCDHPLRIRPEYFGSSLACKRCDGSFVPSLARAVTNFPARPTPLPTRRLVSG